MPELPEVETVRRGLNQLTLHQPITSGEVLLARTVAYPFAADQFIGGLKGSTIESWIRCGKYLLAELSSSAWLGVHLRMTGQLLWLSQEESLHKHTRVRLFFGKEQELRFVDQRTFGKMWYVPSGVVREEIITGLGKLAIDPFAVEFTPEYLATKLAKVRRPIKTALLDQSIVAGLGNIYADEALFKSGILPTTICTNIGENQIRSLRMAIIEVLSASIAAGGTTFSNFLNVKGVNGNYGGEAWVYNRAGDPCKVCGSMIQRTKLSGRSSHFCPQCQS
ncbi:DNA-formamidopyrimidine glycosylase [Cylindrospermopsis raciborskii CS-506_D]|uniref:Formamidopyrimidine-DNA glycosylase n=1 Tax=Cylindrospermopsis raciborskii CS-506_A TaxID=2585140 RepID=A0A838WWY8_9CYAN|nr:DNA-formamidopyrimidine glycosylase [Cylindrospermopsis raciborskii]MBA4446466.1 DNA-formamidopyrimidine glycosylase [Cylindrospermopsis raciborskii CS-506_C]MBA4450700.1 DNA-formamidopyrimidine glycosylase [Cylindrospermopsis raciborskii CS-506_D]MBA4457307.1 DNA-formamidopyrimidine glycosylase [Cylindrospermopsis raciborskii CS-506_B]MBA4466679.1 DNA-formamidopyrimidine glycosylase [Cylindrospermopsis raciborskii CS-506_A]